MWGMLGVLVGWAQALHFCAAHNDPSPLWPPQGIPEMSEEEIVSVPDAKYTKGEFEVSPGAGSGLGLSLCYLGAACLEGLDPLLGREAPGEALPVLQVVMKVVQLLPDGHRMKKEVDMALDTVSETMTPMHYHLREIIICTYRQVRPLSPSAPGDSRGFSRALGPALPKLDHSSG